MKKEAFFARMNRVETSCGPLKTACVALLLLLPSVVQAQFIYTTNSGAITVSKYTGPGGAVAIPSVVGDMPVISIGAKAFFENATVTSVTIPNSVTSIGSEAFSYCSGLTGVAIPNSVVNIETYAFSDCNSLLAINVDVAHSVYGSVEGVLFNKSLTTLLQYPGGRIGNYTIPGTVTSIGSGAFSGCSSLTGVTIPGSVTSIGNYAFNWCTSLPGVIIPNGITSVGYRVFYECISLTNVVIPGTVTSIASGAFSGCSRLVGVTIPNGVTSIGSDAFSYCGLTDVTIPNSVASVGAAAFADCTSLLCISVDAAHSVYSSVDGVLFNKSQTTLIQCPGGKVGSYTIPDGVVSLGSGSFSSCGQLTGIVIPNTVTNIGSYAFYWCTSLNGLTIPNSVASIGAQALYGCTKVVGFTVDAAHSVFSSADGVLFNKSQTTLIQYPGGKAGSYTIPAGVVSVGDGAFYWCTNLTSVSLPASVTSLGADSFAYCTRLAVVYCQGNAPSLGASAFYYDNNATVYYLQGTTGWGATLGGRPAVLWGVGPVSVTMALGNLSATYDGTPKAVTISTVPAGLSVALTYYGSAMVPVNAGSYLVTAAVTDPRYVGSVTNTLEIGKASQTLTFGELSAKTVGDAPFTLNAASSSGLAVGFASDNSGVATVNGNLVAIVGAGVATITATQSGNSNYLAAPSVPQTLLVIPIGSFNYTTNNGTITIAKYTGAGGAVVIPSMINGMPVVGIGAKAFFQNVAVTSVTIPSSVTSIASEAFSYCSGLTGVAISKNVTTIETYAFSDCNSLMAITVDPQNLVYSSVDGVLFNKSQSTLMQYPGGRIGNYAIPGTVTIIGSGAFSGCSSMTGVTIPASVTSIGNYAFNWCTSLSGVVIPNGITSIGYRVFYTCVSLTNATIPASVTSIGTGAFSSCSRLASVTIPSSVTSIAGDAFSYSGLTNVTIPNSVTSIGTYAFSDCTSLMGINVDAAHAVYSSVGGVLFNKSQTILMQYPGGKAGSYTIPNGVTSLASGSFSSAERLTGVTIPGGVTSIGSYAFYSCTNLTTVSVPGSVTSLGGSSFAYCTSLAVVYCQGNAPTLGSNVFLNDNNATVYYLQGTTGWGATFGGRPTVQWGTGPVRVAVTLGNLEATYDGTPKQVTVITDPAGLNLVVKYDGGAMTPVNAGSYMVTATVTDPRYVGGATNTLVIGKASQMITFGALAVKTYGDAPFALDAASSTGMTLSYASDNEGVATVSGNVVTIVGAGTATITASQSGNNNYLAASVQQTLTVNPASATVVLGSLVATYDGTGKAASATTTPVGLSVALTYDGGLAVPVNAGSYTVIATITDGLYVGSATNTLVIGKASQAIPFGALAAKTYGDAPFALGSSASSGLLVSYASDNTDVAMVSGNTVTIVGVGSATITASQPGDNNYFAAAPVQQVLVVNSAIANVVLGDLASTYDGTGKAASVTTTPAGLSVAVTYDGSDAAPVNAGAYTVVAMITDAMYVGCATNTLVIGKAAQTISFGALAAKTYGDASFTLGGTSISGLPVSYASDNESVATVSGITVAIVGAGTASITASQAGNSNYLAAVAVAQPLVVNPASATVSLGDLAPTYDGTGKAASVTTTPAGLSVSLTYSGSADLPVNAGSYSVVATVTDSNYVGSAMRPMVISKASQTITFDALSAKAYGDGPFAPGAISSSGLPVSYASDKTTVATVSENMVTIMGVGTAGITAMQAGNSNYLTAVMVTQTLTVNQAVATVVLGNLAPAYTGTGQAASVTTTPAGLRVSLTYNGSAALPVNVGSYTVVATVTDPNYSGGATNTLVISKAGATVVLGNLVPTYTGTGRAVSVTTTPARLSVAVTYDGSEAVPVNAGSYVVVATVMDPSYEGGATNTLVIEKASQTITFGALAAKAYGVAPFTLAATASSGLAVDYASGNEGVATVSGSTATIVGTGTVGITARQAGNSNYLAAVAVTQPLTVIRGSATVSLGDLAPTYDGTGKAASATTTPAGLSVSLTYNGSADLPVNAGSYSVVATVTDSNYVGTTMRPMVIAKASQTITFDALAAKTSADGAFAPGATSSSGLAVSYASDRTTVATVSGNMVTIVGVGTAGIKAMQAGNSNYLTAVPVTQTLTVNPAEAMVVLGNLAPTYTGTGRAASVTTTPAGLSVAVTYNGSAALPVNVGSYTVVATVVNPNYSGGATNTLVISRAVGTVVLGNLTPTYTGTGRAASVTTTPAGLSVAVTYDGSAALPVNAGSYVVVATVTNPDYSGGATNTLVIEKASQTVTFGALAAKTYGVAPFALVATASSGLAVSCASDNEGVVTVSGKTVTVVGAGTAGITARQTGNSNYLAAVAVTQPLVVNRASATVTLGSLAAMYDGTGKAASATTTPAGLGVSLTYNGSATAPVDAGSYTVVGTITDSNYVGTATKTLVIAKAGQTITFGALAAKTYGDGPFALGATSSSGLVVSYVSDKTTVATVSGDTVTVVGSGTAGIKATQAGDSNYLAATSVTQPLTVNRASATVSLGDLAATYDGMGKAASVTTTPTGLSVSLTYNGSATVPVNVGSYTVVATVLDPSYSGGATNTLVISKAGATVVLGNLAATYTGTGKAVSVTTTPAGLSVSLTYNGSTAVPVNAGSYVVVATITNPDYSGGATNVLVIGKEVATVVLGNLVPTYTGTGRAASVATTPVGLSVAVTYDGSSALPVNAGSYVVVATVTNPDYEGGATNTLVIEKANQTITFGALAAKTYGVAPFALAATASSGLALDYVSGNEGVATVSGSTATIVGTGTVGITARQAGNSNYLAAVAVTQPLTVNRGSATVSLGDLAPTYDGTGKAASATTTPAGLSVSLTYNGSADLPVNAGSYSVVATITDTNYVGSTMRPMVIAKASQTIMFGALAVKTSADGPFAPGATSSSGLAVSYASDKTTVATVSGNMVTIMGMGTAGIKAMQAGNSNYLAALPVTQTLTVKPAEATVVLGNLAPTYTGTGRAVSVMTTPAGLNVTVTYNGGTALPVNVGSYTVVAMVVDPNYSGGATNTLVIGKEVATVVLGNLVPTYTGTGRAASVTTTPAGLSVAVTYDGSAALPVNAGSYTVVATVTNPDYSGGATNTLVIEKANQTITFGTLAAKTCGTAPFALAATASSGLAVDYASGNAGVATVSGSTATIVGTGTAGITATQAGNSNYLAAVAVTQPLTVNRGSATVSLGDLAPTYDGTGKAASATTTPAGLSVSLTYNGSTDLPVNAGSYSVVATVTDSNYVGSAMRPMVIAKASQTITFDALAAKSYGDGPFAPGAMSSSGLTVSYASDKTTVATVSGNMVTIVGVGTAGIKAMQAGNSNYLTAVTVTQPLTVNQAEATVVLGNLAPTYNGTGRAASVATTPAGLSVAVTYDGSPALPVNAGSYTVVATVVDPKYTGGATNTLVIGKASQTITFGALAAKTYGVAPFALVATASSGLAVSGASDDEGVAKVSGKTVTVVGAGTAGITVSQPGNSNYLAAVAVTQPLTVNRASATVTVGGLAATYNATVKAVTVTTTPAGLSVSLTYNGSADLPVNAGSYTVVATVTDANYAGSVTKTLVIAKASQTITFAALPTKAFGSAPFALSATASSGLPLSYVSSKITVATVSGNIVTIVGVGTAGIKASQAGNSNYLAAVAVTKNLVVSPAAGSLAAATTVNSGPAISILPSSLTMEGARFGFSAAGGMDGRYEIEVSSDLKNWGTITTITNAGGSLSFAEPAPGGQNRFYRLRLKQ
jgi:hypothetical protein